MTNPFLLWRKLLSLNIVSIQLSIGNCQWTEDGLNFFQDNLIGVDLWFVASLICEYYQVWMLLNKLINLLITCAKVSLTFHRTNLKYLSGCHFKVTVHFNILWVIKALENWLCVEECVLTILTWLMKLIGVITSMCWDWFNVKLKSISTRLVW